jgi:hypothetical protein
MTQSRLSALGLILVVFLCFQTTRAQQTNSSNDERAAADAAVRDKAFKLLESLADQLGSLQSAENRARIGSNIAESIWSHDEERARNLFRLVAEDIKLGLQQTKDDHNNERTFAVFEKLRQDNVERIAKHDPELALSFLKETFPYIVEVVQEPNGSIPPPVVQREHELEMRLATKIGPRNPAAAVQLARQSLEQGFSDNLLVLLSRLNSKDRNSAQLLYKDIVRKLGTTDFNNRTEKNQYYPALNFALKLAQRFTPPAADEATYTELLNVFLTQARANGCERPLKEADEDHERVCAFVGTVVPLIEKYNPQARRLDHWVPEGSGNGSPDVSQFFEELEYLYQNGSVDEILSLKAKHPQFEGDILMRAVAKAEAEGDIERAQKLAGSYNGDRDIRGELDRQVALYTMSEAKLEEQWAAAEKELANEPAPEQVQALLFGAVYTATISKKVTLKGLDRASGLIDSFAAGERQTQLQMLLAADYCLVKDDRCFIIMEPLLPKLNELVGAAAKLDGYDTQYLRDGEWNMSAAGSTGNLLTLLANYAGAFAWCDFDRAVSLSGQFDRIEIRMMAQLKLAQSILAGRQQRIVIRGMASYD